MINIKNWDIKTHTIAYIKMGGKEGGNDYNSKCNKIRDLKGNER